MILNEKISLTTQGNSEIIDITGQVRDILKEKGISNGILTVFIPGSTGAITTIEYESGALEDMQNLLETIAPQNKNYKHNLRWGDGNGHSHLRSALLGPSLVVPIVDGSLTLGTWQQIVFIDCDNRPRQRSIEIQIVGE